MEEVRPQIGGATKNGEVFVARTYLDRVPTVGAESLKLSPDDRYKVIRVVSFTFFLFFFFSAFIGWARNRPEGLLVLRSVHPSQSVLDMREQKTKKSRVGNGMSVCKYVKVRERCEKHSL